MINVRTTKTSYIIEEDGYRDCLRTYESGAPTYKIAIPIQKMPLRTDGTPDLDLINRMREAAGDWITDVAGARPRWVSWTQLLGARILASGRVF